MKRILLNLGLIIIASMIITPFVSGQEKEVEKRVKIIKVDETGKKVEIDTVLTGDMALEDLDLPEGIKIKKGENFRYYFSDDDAKEIFVTIEEESNISEEEDEDVFHIKKSDVIVMKKGDSDSFSIYMTDDAGKEGKKEVVTWISSDGDTIKKEAHAFAGDSKSFAWVSGGDDEDIHVHEGNVFIKSGDKKHSYVVVKPGKGDSGKEVYEFISSDELDDDEKEIIIHSSDGHEKIRIKGDAVIKIVDGKVKVEAGEVEKEVEKKAVKKKKK